MMRIRLLSTPPSPSPASLPPGGAAAQPVAGDPPPAPATARHGRTHQLRRRLLRPIRAAHRARHRPAGARLRARPRATNGDDVRGFAGAAGNVVINGARPSSKAETLETTLPRIPAQRVVRVEVGPGDLYGAEYSSKSQVLNIILSAEGGIDGNVTGSVRRLYTGRVVPDGSAARR